MYASIQLIQVAPDGWGEFERVTREVGIPTLQRQPGFLAAHVLRGESDEAILVVYYQDRDQAEAALAAASAALRQQRHLPITGRPLRRGGEVVLTVGSL
jgi:heme-degrading monooxygenase HmoA